MKKIQRELRLIYILLKSSKKTYKTRKKEKGIVQKKINYFFCLGGWWEMIKLLSPKEKEEWSIIYRCKVQTTTHGHILKIQKNHEVIKVAKITKAFSE